MKLQIKEMTFLTKIENIQIKSNLKFSHLFSKIYF